jgi:hypothetical protein
VVAFLALQFPASFAGKSCYKFTLIAISWRGVSVLTQSITLSAKYHVFDNAAKRGDCSKYNREKYFCRKGQETERK